MRWVDVLNKIIENYNNTENNGMYGFTPNEAKDNPFIMNFIINEKRDEENKITENMQIINVGDYCRVKITKNIFDKMQSKYNDEIYKIMKINKNSVMLDNDKLYKKTNILLVDVSKLKKSVLLDNSKPANNIKKEVDKEYKIERKLKQLKKDNIDQDNILETKRTRKPIIN